VLNQNFRSLKMNIISCFRSIKTCFFLVWALMGLLLANAHAADELWLGGGLNDEEAYLGARHNKTSPIPAFDWRKGTYFARMSRGHAELGVQTEVTPSFYVGAQLGFEPGRQVQDLSPLLTRMGVNAYPDSAGLGLHAELRGKFSGVPLASVVRYRQRSSLDRGALLDWRYDMGVYASGAFGMGLNFQTIWGNATAMRSDFGVSNSQAAAAGVSAHEPGAGLREMAWGLAAQYDLRSDLQAIASIKRKQLKNAAAESPLVERRYSSGLAAGLLWGF
jgi:outer membrane scaffolding protein for murein synthesis (MipA/OmpV family)